MSIINYKFNCKIFGYFKQKNAATCCDGTNFQLIRY